MKIIINNNNNNKNSNKNNNIINNNTHKCDHYNCQRLVAVVTGSMAVAGSGGLFATGSTAAIVDLTFLARSMSGKQLTAAVGIG